MSALEIQDSNTNIYEPSTLPNDDGHTNTSSTSFLKNLVNTGTNLLFSSSSSISPPGLNTTTTTNNNSDSNKPLSFENDLSEGFDGLVKRSEIGIEQCKELLDYFKHRASIEEKYSKSVTNYFSKFKVKDDNDSFQNAVSLINKISESEANTHKSFSQNLINNLCHPFSTLIKDMEQRRKNLVSDGQKLKNELKDSIENLKKAHIKYEKICNEMESAKLELIEREPDANSVKVQSLERKLAKCESNSIIAEEEYKNQLKETNEFITGLYQIRLSENLNEFEQFESMRLQFMKSNVKNYVALMADLSLEGEIKSANNYVDTLIDPDNDLQHYIKTNSSSKRVIIPFLFEPYGTDQYNKQHSSFSQQQYALNYASPLTSPSTANTQAVSSSSSTQPIEIPQHLPITSSVETTSTSNTGTSSPPAQPVQTKQSLKENIFGFFNKATTNLKSSTSSLINTKDEVNSSSSNGTGQLSKSSSSFIGLPISNSNSIFGIELEVLIENDVNSNNKNNNSSNNNHNELEVPLILTYFVQTLLKLNALEKEGLFVTLPTNFNIQQEKQRLDQSGYHGLDNITDIHLIATLFKHWIGDLPNPLISYAIYDEIIESPQNSWKIIESGIPTLHRRVLHYIIDFLVEFVKCSKLDTHTVSMIYTPVLIRSPTSNDISNTLLNSKKEIAVIENMIIDSFEGNKSTKNNYILKRNLPIISDDDQQQPKSSDDDESGGDIDDGNNSNTSHDEDEHNQNEDGQEENNSNNNNNNSNNSSNGSSNGSNGNITHHFLYQTTPTSNNTPILSSASDFFDECINTTSKVSNNNNNTNGSVNNSNLPPRNSSNLSFGNSDTFSTNQSDSEPVLIESYDNDDFDILSYK